MAALVAAHEAIAPTGLFGVVAAAPATSRPLTLMGLDQTIVLYPTLAHAVTAMMPISARLSQMIMRRWSNLSASSVCSV